MKQVNLFLSKNHGCPDTAIRKKYRPDKPKGRKTSKLLGLIMLLLLLGTPQGWADIGNQNLASYNGYSSSEGYIEFKVPIYHQVGNDTKSRSNSRFYIGTENNNKTVFNYELKEGKGSWTYYEYRLKINLSEYEGRIAVKTYDSGGGSSWTFIKNSAQNWSPYYNAKKEGNTTHMYVRFYPAQVAAQQYGFYHHASKTASKDIQAHQDMGHYSFGSPNMDFTFSAEPSYSTYFSLKYTLNASNLPTGVKKVNVRENKYSEAVNIGSNTVDIELDKTGNTKTYTVYYYWVQAVDPMCTTPVTIAKAQTITLPAYTQPTSLSATYTKSTGTVAVKWDVNTTPHGSENTFIKGGWFEIQRTTNAGNWLDDAKKDTVHFVRYQSTYTYTDQVSSISDKGMIHYRVRRINPPTEWSSGDINWNTNPGKSVSVTVSTVAHAAITANSVDVVPEGKGAKITWKIDDLYWTTGSQLIIKKYNRTSNTPMSDITLPKQEDFRKCEYIDENIATCVEYEYTLYVKPGNTNYNDQIREVPAKKSILVVEVGAIKEFTASKGYYSDRTSLRWKAEGRFDEFIIRRAEYGSNEEAVQIATVNATVSSDYLWDDEKGIAGTYYTYSITGVILCSNEPKESSGLKDIGFRTPTGNIYGRVSYQNGQAVDNVEILLEATNIDLGYSMLLSDNTSLFIPKTKQAISNDHFTFQTWFRFDGEKPSNQTLFYSKGQYEVGFDGSGKLFFGVSEGNTRELVTSDTIFAANKFYHVSAVKNGQELLLYIDGVWEDNPYTMDNGLDVKADTIYLGSNGTAKRFIGYMDEVRLWNRALSKEEIKRDYTRLIVGDEEELIGYYRFNEEMTDAFYDLSFVKTKYNESHGVVKNGTRSELLPSDLGLKGMTDKSGDYFINGVPYVGNGTQYTITPRKGDHQFDPPSRPKNIGHNNPSVQADFTDLSSFTVEGVIYYENTNVPVAGVNFKIDGIYVDDGRGGLAATNTRGEFSISVPVGVHEVIALKTGHTFNEDGRLLANGKDRDYQSNMAGVKIWDQTKIRWIGRVVGGAVQEAFPVGHSLSTNNLGDNPVIVLKRQNTWDEFIIDEQAQPNDPPLVRRDTINHLNPPRNKKDVKEGAKRSQTIVETWKDVIYIYPDEITGEFYVDLIPYKFKLDSVSAEGHDNDIVKRDPNVASELDFQESIHELSEAYSYMDSIPDGRGGMNYFQYNDTVFYHHKESFIKRVKTEIDFYQVNPSGERLAFMGESEIEFSNLFDESFTIPIYAGGKYTFQDEKGVGIPTYLQGKQYRYIAQAFEGYRYNGSTAPEDLDRVPTVDGTLVVTNNLATSNEVNISLPLDENGTVLYIFTADVPDMGATATKDFNAYIKLSNNQIDDWEFAKGVKTMKAFTIGSRSRGSDFVTNGPKQLITVLRDPPGSNSYAYLEKGTVITSTSTTKEGVKQSGEEDIRAAMGAEYKAAAGTPFFMQVTEIKTENSAGGIVAHEQAHLDGNSTTKKTTLMTRFETSGDPSFVGRDGDVLIGNSTNIVYGICDMYLMMDKDSDAAKDGDITIATSADGKYKLVRRKSYNSDVQFETVFAHPQVHIENRLIPELIDFKNNILQYGAEWTPANAQAYADANNEAVYVSHLSPEDEYFGCSNNDDEAFGTKSNGATFQTDGPSYKIYFPKKMPAAQQNDTIFALNQSINNWYDLLAQNERAKLRAQRLHNNYSFHAGSQIEYSEEYSYETASTYEYEYFVGAQAVVELGFLFNGFGFKTSIKEGGYEQGAEETSESEENTRKEGFVLGESGSDYLSVDVYYESSETMNYESSGSEELDEMLKGPFVYRTRGGVTSCPYEGARYTKYYQPGTLLDEATVQQEVPVLKVEPTVVSSVPLTRPAVFRLTLENQSESNEDVYFVLQVLEGTNPNGAKLSIDGQAFTNTGRSFLVPYGQPLTKTLEVRAGADSMRYENIKLILRSQCQYDPTGYQETIADTVSISAYFVPGCSDINIRVPLENFIVNTRSECIEGVYQLPIILDNYDPNNMSLDRIEIQMKQEDESQWLIKHTFHTDSTKVLNKKTESIFDRTKARIEYRLPMEDYDSRYQIRAVTYCYDSGEEIPTASAVVTGTKDTERPKLFGSPQPANGILDVESNIQLTFNETIKEGALSRYNFQVTGIKNGSNTNHNASIEFDGVNDYLATEAERNLVDRDLTVEMWTYRATGSGAGTLFSFGNQKKSLDFGFTANDRLTVQYNGATITSDALPIQAGTQWAHVAMVYEASSATASLYYNTVKVLDFKPIGVLDAIGHFEFGRSIQGSGYYKGKIHEARIWSTQRTATDLQVNRLKIFSGSETGLIGYYPMSECKGKVAYDKATGANAAMYAEWSMQASRAVSFDGNAIVNVPSVEMTDEMDYTIELWFKAEPGQTNTTLVSNEIKQTANIPGISNAQRFFLGFNGSGKLLFRSNAREEIIENKDATDYRDNNWHHLAFSLNRITRRAEAFVDGNLITQFSIYDMEGMSADAVSIGGIRIFNNLDVTGIERGFKGSIDEVRFWNSALTEDLVNNFNNTRLNGDEMGLVAYYPFEEYTIVNGMTSLKYSLNNLALTEDAKGETGVATNAKESTQTAPIKDRGPVENIAYSFVVSDKSVIIYLEEDMDMIEKSTVTFSMKGVQDMFGNETLSPIIWSAYIDRNLLKWATDEVHMRKNEYAPLEFEVDIQNTGGAIERFTIENLPVWLTATPMTGTVGAKGKQTIKFVINEGVNVGRYSEMIYMKNSKNVSELLTLNLVVGGDMPDWKVNPGDFEHNMSVFGKLRVEGIFSNDKEDMIAAFIDGRCVGVVNNTYQSKTNTWYTFLTVYGNKEHADADIEFRIWDSSTGKTYAATTSREIKFKNQSTAGTAETPLIFDTSEMVFQNMKLNQGWNWISFQIGHNRLNEVSYILQNATWSSNDLVKDENNFDSYSTTTNSWAGTLSQSGGFNNTSLYMLKTSQAKVLSVNGRQIDPKATPIQVKGGKWNYISYLPAANMNIDEALTSYPAQSGDIIKSQQGFAMFDGYAWIGNLAYLEPNKGYMLLRTATSDVSFNYPTITGSLSTKSTSMENNFCYQNYDHANNMTLTAVIDKNFDLRKGDRVVAMIDNEVRGMSEVTHTMLNELHFINVVSDEPGIVRFVIERNGSIVATASTKFDYGVNKVVGSLEEPIVLDFTGKKNISLYPNPFTTKLNIDFTLEQTADVEIRISDMTGRLIHKWNKQSYGAGNHIVVWNAPQVHIAGIYLVTIVIDGEISSHKVIKTN